MSIQDDHDELLTPAQYALERKCSTKTLERERATGSGPPFLKFGGAVRYSRKLNNDYHFARIFGSTAEAAAAECQP
jgi:hypothetical protein